MVDQARHETLTLTFKKEDYEKLKTTAQRRGFDAPFDYLRSLIEENGVDEADEDDVESKEELLEGFRQSFRQAMRGEGTDIHQLLDSLSSDQKTDDNLNLTG